MAQKAAKSLAVRNAQKLTQTHLISLAVHLIFILLAFTIRRSLSLKPWLLLSVPAFALEGYLDVLGRPRYSPDGTSLKKSGENLDAKGLTEYFWDVIYWTWINVIIVIIFGNRGWWLYTLVPVYTAYAVFSAARGLTGALGGGLAGAGREGDAVSRSSTQSKRQSKLEKRGGEQRVKYR